MPKIDLEPGDELYVGSMWYIDHGEDDMCGGIAIVKKLKVYGGTTFVEFKGLSHSPNLDYLLEHQEEWEKEYKNRVAHDCPEGRMCPALLRVCPLCEGKGFQSSGVCKECKGTGAGKIKKNEKISKDEMLEVLRRRAFRDKLMRQARREIE